MSILRTMHDYLSRYEFFRSFCVGYSGGKDSHVMLHALSLLREQLNITVRAIHINHGLSPQATQWAEHCQSVCDALNIPLTIVTVALEDTKQLGVEAAARAARYHAFSERLSAEECLVTGHHQQDQAETLLLQMLRGAGPKGLAAMPTLTTFAEAFHWRPLLATNTQEITDYADLYRLAWVEDESNQDIRFDRNFLRQEIFPRLKERWPQCPLTMSRSAGHYADTAELLENLAELDFKQVATEQESALDIPVLLRLSEKRQRNLLRYWLVLHQVSLPSSVALEAIISDLIHAAPDAVPVVKLHRHELRRFKRKLYLQLDSSFESQLPSVSWHGQDVLEMPNLIGNLIADEVVGKGIAKRFCRHLTIRFRQGGERCQPEGRVGSHPLKKLFQEWEVAPWLRDKVPLIYLEDEIIAVVGYCICEGFQAEDDDLGIDFFIDETRH